MPRTSGNSTRAATGGFAVTTDEAFESCSSLLCSADTVADVTFADGGTVEDVPLVKGYNYIQATKIVFGAGTIIALYN